MKLKLLVAFIVLLAVSAHAQLPSYATQVWASTAYSGQARLVSPSHSQYVQRFVISSTGSPTSVAVVINGCNNGFCSWVGEWDTAQTGDILVLGYYNQFQITPTFSGGSSPTVTVSLTSYDGDGWGPSIAYSPAQLGISALATGAGVNSAYTPILVLTGTRSIAVEGMCNQTFKLVGKFYAEDGTTAIYTGDITTANAVLSTWGKYSMTEQSGSVDFGFAGLAASTAFRLPIKAAQFALNNTSVSAGTCTVRLLLQY